MESKGPRFFFRGSGGGFNPFLVNGFIQQGKHNVSTVHPIILQKYFL